jgi:hypothetical protein
MEIFPGKPTIVPGVSYLPAACLPVGRVGREFGVPKVLRVIGL